MINMDGTVFKTLHLVLKYQWFDKIKSGEKTIEYRRASDYWKKRIKNIDIISFRRGYQKNAEIMIFKCDKIKLINGIDTDLNIDSIVYALFLGDRIQ
jgi:ASC-1-like (ASCH) protein